MSWNDSLKGITLKRFWLDSWRTVGALLILKYYLINLIRSLVISLYLSCFFLLFYLILSKQIQWQRLTTFNTKFLTNCICFIDFKLGLINFINVHGEFDSIEFLKTYFYFYINYTHFEIDYSHFEIITQNLIVINSVGSRTPKHGEFGFYFG